jgi:hypothetical protein
VCLIRRVTLPKNGCKAVKHEGKEEKKQSTEHMFKVSKGEVRKGDEKLHNVRGRLVQGINQTTYLDEKSSRKTYKEPNISSPFAQELTQTDTLRRETKKQP